MTLKMDPPYKLGPSLPYKELPQAVPWAKASHYLSHNDYDADNLNYSWVIVLIVKLNSE